MNKFQRMAGKLILGQSFDEYVQRFMTGGDLDSDMEGFNIDSQTALKYSAVFACNKVLAETLASLPILEYRKKANGERDITTSTNAYDILHNQPNDEMAPFAYKEACMTALNLGGNSISQRLFNKAGELVGLYPYEYTKVEIQRNKDTKKLQYVIRDGPETTTLQRDEVFHIPNMSLNGIVGLSPITYAAAAIRLGISYEQFGNNFYKNGANASGAFKSVGALSEEAFNRLKRELKKNYAGLRNTGTPMLLEEGLDFQQFTINPVDAQLLESKSFQAEDICRIYRVPQHLIQLLGHATFTNIEQQSLEFVMYTMLPWFNRWEENINMQLLTPLERKAGFYLEFKVDSLLRGDAQSRATAYAQGRQWGWLSVNDIRKLENMPPIGPAGDIYMMPLNMGDAGQVQQDDQQKAMSEAIYKMITLEKAS